MQPLPEEEDDDEDEKGQGPSVSIGLPSVAAATATALAQAPSRTCRTGSPDSGGGKPPAATAASASSREDPPVPPLAMPQHQQQQHQQSWASGDGMSRVSSLDQIVLPLHMQRNNDFNLAFLSGQLQPVPMVDRSSTSQFGESKVQDEPYFSSQLSHEAISNMLQQPTASSLTMMAAERKLFEEHGNESARYETARRRSSAFGGIFPGSLFGSPFDVSRSNSINLSGGGGPGSAAATSEGTFAELHPVLQNAGRTTLGSLRERNNVGGAMANYLQNSGAMSFPNMQPNHPIVPSARAADASLGTAVSFGLASAATTASSGAEADQASHRQHQLSFDSMLDMPSDQLSEYLPTAESLAMEDLFDTSDAGAATLAAAVDDRAARAMHLANHLANVHQQQQQQQLQQQQYRLPPNMAMGLQSEQFFLPSVGTFRTALNNSLAPSHAAAAWEERQQEGSGNPYYHYPAAAAAAASMGSPSSGSRGQSNHPRDGPPR